MITCTGHVPPRSRQQGERLLAANCYYCYFLIFFARLGPEEVGHDMVWVGFKIPARQRSSPRRYRSTKCQCIFEVCTFLVADFSINCWGPSVMMWKFLSLNHYQAMNNLKQDGSGHFMAKNSIWSHSTHVGLRGLVYKLVPTSPVFPGWRAPFSCKPNPNNVVSHILWPCSDTGLG